MNITALNPFDLQRCKSAIAVLPALPSTMVTSFGFKCALSGLFNFFSTSISKYLAARSLTLPHGFINSHLANISHCVSLKRDCNRTKEVLPIKCVSRLMYYNPLFIIFISI
eukprot:NODE_115_length_18417_cov_0.666012.p16 type:complete len:111 gc:universal NODE_115_length_18417_cov_0.666012:14130-14462(+)